MTLDLTCRCKGFYTCVACKVKRGDYKTWQALEPERAAPSGPSFCIDCGFEVTTGPRCITCGQQDWQKRRLLRRSA